MTHFNRDFLRQLSWRYAVKKFDASRAIEPEVWSDLQQALRLAPSSFGLQPWKFVVVTNADVKAALVEHSWGQRQIAECSHLVVFASKTDVDDAYVDRFLDSVAQQRGVGIESLAGYRRAVLNFLSQMDATSLAAWATHQAYLALGQLLTTAAVLSVDACPMEGIDPVGYDQQLHLSGSGYATRVACALGYRDGGDSYASAAKVRFGSEEVFEFVR